ncbi:hypothetical protein GCM10008101_01520 [Lysobacter xinjiangensis]|uniref:Thymidine phosphorylase n=1 Tax=Cognatilysobacter xinjiangensis TaxID=546892 RepID=A0ABQ3BMY7_9GAMM|nr:DUF1631 family protein [Lysobacter xinjiangensis]GGZ52153.1 hypothetical protein GCM10008101_01520 [Lysobacter xinjiangensis]
MSVPFPPNRRIPAADALASASLPARVREALLVVHAAVYELVIDPLDRLIPHIEARLMHVRDQGARHSVGISYLDQAQLLARRQRAFIERFARNVDEEFAGLRDASREPQRPLDTPVAMPAFEDLRLVDEDEADEQTEVKAIALRQESRAPLPIHLLCQRFAVLAESPAFDPGRLPVGPRRLCELMLAAAEASGFSLALRVALLREFDRAVLAEYAGIAESINEALARLRIMPGLSFVPLRVRARASSADAGDDATPPQPEGERPHTGWTATPPSSADTPTFQLLQDLLAARRSMADRFRGGGFAPGTGAAATGGGLALEGVGAPTMPGRRELPTAAVLEMLRGAGDDVLGLDIDAIRQWVLLQGRHRQGEAVALSREDADIFELLGLMYTQLQRDVRGDSAAALMLERLRLPLLRLALADASFFLRAAHPAREVLNAVAESGARWYAADDVDPQLLLQLERIVDAIARAPDDLGAAFRAGVTALESQLQAVARRSEIAERRNVEAARGKDKLAVARRRGTTVIDQALATVRVPAFHRGMLRQAWADVLTLAHLRNGEEGDDWLALVDATHELVRAAAGQGAAPDLVLLVDQWLATVGYHADDAARIARILTGTEDEAGDDAASRTELAMRLKARARLGEETAVDDDSGADALQGEARVMAERVRALPPGTWFDLPDEGGRSMRRRLSWLSPVTGTTLFVNPRGQRVADGTLDRLARDLADGRARIVTADEGRLVDRAWRAALQSLGDGRPREASR